VAGKNHANTYKITTKENSKHAPQGDENAHESESELSPPPAPQKDLETSRQVTEARLQN
jgi:hypothetical protein